MVNALFYVNLPNGVPTINASTILPGNILRDIVRTNALHMAAATNAIRATVVEPVMPTTNPPTTTDSSQSNARLALGLGLGIPAAFLLLLTLYA